MKNYIDFRSAKCRDCYRCLKACPVKAIKLVEHQARIIPERCIQCGSCIRVCPQNAKTVHSELAEVRELLQSGRKVVASVAPSFISSFELEDFEPMRGVLKQLGFAYAEETAVGAAAVTQAYTRLLESGEYKCLISSACPSINRLIQIYYPAALKYLAPVDTPMAAHSKLLKKRFPDAFVVFIGPCISKKREAAETGLVENVLTFEELLSWMSEEGVSFDRSDVPRLSSAPGAGARCYPTDGGIIRSFTRLPEGYEYMSADTLEKCGEILMSVQKLDKLFIEMNACKFACINGPCSLTNDDIAVSAELCVRKYAAASKEAGVDTCGADFGHALRRVIDGSRTPGESEIREILAKTGKFKPEDELNCGACGYSSCREKAWAVANGYAEDNMCIPYMRSKAESVTSEVISRIPFGIIVLNSSFNIESINRAAVNILGIDSFHPEGQQLFDFISIPDFVIAQSTNTNVLNKRIALEGRGKIVELSVILLKEHSRLLGILKDVTAESSYNDKLREVRLQTYKVTDDVVKKQMRIAQEIASLLGETTAETKVALLKLKELMQEEE